MKISIYVAKNVLLIIIAVLCVIMAIDLVFSLTGEVGSVGQNGYTWRNAILNILFRAPSDVDLIFPIAGFLGTFIALIILSSKSELIAMRAAGFSLRQIAAATLIAGAGILALYYALSLFIAPYTRHLSYLEKNFHGKDQNILVLSSETWLKSGNHFLLMGQVLPDGVLNDVTDYIVNNDRLTEVRHIQTITLHNNETWTLDNVKIMNIAPTGVSANTVVEITEPSLISTNLLPALAMEPDEMMIQRLAEYIQFRKDNNLDAKNYQLQFWNRIFAPLMLPIMMLLAIPFGMSNNRSGIQVRIVLSLCVGFAFYIVSQFFGSLTLLSSLPAIWGASLPPLLFGIMALLLFSLLR